MNLPIEAQIKLDRFKPRSYQHNLCREFESGKIKKFLVIWPRRSGKDICALNLMVRAALRRVGTYYYCFPTFSSGRRILWDAIDISGNRVLNHYIPDEIVESRNEQQMRIRLTNGSQIQILGSDNADTALVGTNALGIIFSEYALSDPRSYSYAIPILKASNGWCLFVTTPRGKNALWDLYQVAKESPDWFCERLSIDETNHIDIEEIEKDIAEGQMSRDLAEQEYWCFPASQEVLTSFGSKPISEINSNDMVVSHSGRLRKVIGVISRDYSGEMIEISSFGDSEPIVCTPNHPIRIYHKESQEYEWKEAQHITKEDRVVFPKMHFGSLKIINREMCMLLAWYITEGSCFKNGVQFSVKQSESLEIGKYLTALKIKWDCYPDGSIVNLVVNSSQLVDFFKSNCGLQANNKRIPFTLIAGYEEEFFNELMKGDGCFNDSKNHQKYCYSTVSKSLAYQVQLLANSLNLGYAAGISSRESYESIIEGRQVNCQKSYQVNIGFKGPNDCWLIRAKHSIAARIKDIKKCTYDGTVFNLKVQYDESYLVHGRAVHNCSFELGVEGSFYAKYIDDLRRKGQVSHVLWEPYFPTHVAVDLGYNDPTCIIWFQVIGQTIRVIDCYENNKKGLDHYAKIIKEKEYSYGKFIAPFDIAVHDLGTGISRWKMMHDLGITFIRYADKHPSIDDGIESVRRTLPKMWFDEKKCAPLLKSLENYRQEYDHKKKTYKLNPLHDWSSHWADAMRYLCYSLPKLSSHTSPEDLEKRYNETAYGSHNINMPSVFRDDLPLY